MTFSVSSKDIAQRLDIFLRDQLGSSRREVLRLLQENCVTVNGVAVNEKAKGMPLTLNSEVIVENHERLDIVKAGEIDLSILLTGKGFVVTDKPAGMPVMPQHYSETGTVLNSVVVNHPELQGIGEGGLKSGVVHRLDTDTSGVLIVATSEDRWQQLRSAFKEHRSTKIYHALVHGELRGDQKETAYLVVAQHRPAHVRVIDEKDLDNYPHARECRLSWRVLEPLRDASLLEVTLETGFLHQIRAMFAHKSYPVLGDKRYGLNDPGIARHMLHAASLTVEDIHAESPHPHDFKTLLARLRD